MQYKQAIVVRADLKLPKGKLAAQVAHASVDAATKTERKKFDAWKQQGQMKVVLKVEGEKELKKLMIDANNAGLVTSLIIDAGHTVVEPGTVTCLGIGPDSEENINAIVGKLKLL
jgi:PTH2 family peptidyl-tRNA hydrolase